MLDIRTWLNIYHDKWYDWFSLGPKEYFNSLNFCCIRTIPFCSGNEEISVALIYKCERSEISEIIKENQAFIFVDVGYSGTLI